MFPLTYNQRAIWFDQQLFPFTALYNVSVYTRIHAEVDPIILEKAIRIMVEQNDVFRSVFCETDGVPSQLFRSPDTSDPCYIDYFDFSKEQDPEQVCQDWMSHTATIPLTYGENDLYAFALLKKSDREYFWYLKVHLSLIHI